MSASQAGRRGFNSRPSLQEVLINMRFKKVFLILFLGSCVIISGCTTSRHVSLRDRSFKKGIYHKVKPKETLWRIAKTYGLSVEKIARANNIHNAAQIQENQLIFVPGAKEQKTTILAQEAFDKDDFKWPIKGKVVSFFGGKRSLFENKGIDIQSEFGKNVYASRGGEIVFADYLNGYGETVIVDHGDGYLTIYAYNSDILASLGELVTADVPIAKVGRKDSLALLHFEIRKNSVANNPLYFLP